MAGVQGLKLQHIENSLEQIAQFLIPCLPLANAHATDFITENYWDTLIPVGVRKELLALSQEQLRNLPCAASTHVNRTCTQGRHDTDSAKEKEESTEDTENNANYGDNLNQTDEYEINCHSNNDSNNDSNKQDEDRCTGKCKTINDQHKEFRFPYRCIDDFLSEARSYTIEGIGMAVSPHDLLCGLGADRDEVFVGTYMNQKKSHEIEVMSKVCAALAECLDCKLVVDFGSGKGYLGNHLSLQYELPVLGIDAASTNTQSAEKRNTVIDKQWHSLARNKLLESEGRKLTKKEKKKLKQKEVTSRQAGDIEADYEETSEYSNVVKTNKVVENGSEIESMIKTKSDETFEINVAIYTASIKLSKTVLNETKFVPCTTFIDKKTNFLHLAKLHFPGLFLEHKYVNDHKQSLSIKEKCDSAKMLELDFGEDFSVVKNQCSNVSSLVGKGQVTCADTNNASVCSCFNKATDSFDIDNSCKSKRTVCADVSKQFSMMLAGLHTCGNLASTSMEVFVHSDQLKVLCNIGCCYHLIDEKYLDKTQTDGTDACLNGFPLSRFLNQKQFKLGNTARNLASQSLHRISDFDKLQGERFYPRALLEVLIHTVCGENVEVKGLRRIEQKCKSTREYLGRACDKLAISDKVSDEMIESYIRKYSDDEHRLAAFFQLKAVLAPCIEALIILDRVCFLLEQDQVKDVFLVKMFDPVKSPRCYGIVAMKKTTLRDASN
ncbi:probable methyltransferase-like protein 25 [Mercenaria mercenaria]|uniref:probable methyltransferase-like protein 25 n=1 Tax=Mercenaria mercenaria TaxID=6596 RepID=UPI00234F1616|nr:probable methyltransferase-like protein 25 [Mercenaria mercenaria]